MVQPGVRVAQPAVCVQPPPVPQLRGAVKESFAYFTIKDRLPVTLRGAAEDVQLAAASPEAAAVPGARDAAAAIVEGIHALDAERGANAGLAPFPAWVHDAHLWQGALAGQTWFDGPWLTCECYLYRRLQQLLASGGAWSAPAPPPGSPALAFWGAHDVFARKKQEAFWSSAGGMAEMAEEVLPMLEGGACASDEAACAQFCELLQCALRGNKADLSVHNAGFTFDGSALGDMLVDDSGAAWAHVRRLSGARVDIVLDNAGFELFTDLLLADWLVSHGHAARVVFSVKAFPWFVSDTTAPDFHWTLSAVADAGRQRGSAAMECLAERWGGHLASGAWELATDAFWTSPLPLSAMPSAAPHLFADLAGSSSLVIFKGDLNYRKLTDDGIWPATARLEEAAGALVAPHPAGAERPARFAPFLMLRTAKSDTVCGMAPGVQERVLEREAAAGKAVYGWEWLTDGRYGMVQFWQPPASASAA